MIQQVQEYGDCSNGVTDFEAIRVDTLKGIYKHDNRSLAFETFNLEGLSELETDHVLAESWLRLFGPGVLPWDPDEPWKIIDAIPDE